MEWDKMSFRRPQRSMLWGNGTQAWGSLQFP